MIRIFAPSTPDSVVQRDGVSIAIMVAHVVAVAAVLAPPVQQATREEIIDRLVVFLVPPDAPGSREASEGTAAWRGDAEAGSGQAVAAAITAEPAVEERGELPELTSSALAVAPLVDPVEGALSELEVDSAVVRDPMSAAPEYPHHLLNSGLEGLAEVRYVVDTLGNVDTLSYRVLNASHPDFAVAVRRALPHMRFRPAIQGGRRVRQLVEQKFRFRITPKDTTILPAGIAAPPRPPRT